jgi:hypothetical protein
VESPDFRAERAKGRLLAKIPELRLALRGRVTDHHRLMLRELMEDLNIASWAAITSICCAPREPAEAAPACAANAKSPAFTMG